MDSSEFFTFLSGRSSIREYRGEEVPLSVIEDLMECVSTAPSAGNLESWDIVVVTDPTRKDDLFHASHKQEQVRYAPVIFVVCANYARSMSRYKERGILFALEDASIAATYLMLGCHAAGLASCWVGAFDDDMVRSVLSLPYHVRPVVILTAGYGRGGAVPTTRMPIHEHIHEEEW